ncbi:MAG: DUF6922 domain-containing protein [Acidobacteriota bacterium]
MERTVAGSNRLPPFRLWPAEVRRLFWDRDPVSIRPGMHRAFVIQRILSCGGLGALRWLCSLIPSDELRRHLQVRHGREIDPRRLRYYELILELKRAEVTDWIRRQKRGPLPGRREGG